MTAVTVGSEAISPKSLRRRSESRILQLLVQAAHREGMLSGCDFTEADGWITWRNHQECLRLPGRTFCGGDRMSLDWTRWEGEISGELERLRRLCEVSMDGPWQRLLEETEQGVESQQASYAACLQRPQPSTYLDFEGWTPEGHNLHPGAKTRQGFSTREQALYAPEFTDAVELPWLSVEESLLTVSGVLPEGFRAEDGRFLVPVHPWQLRHRLPQVYAAEWADGRISRAEREPLVCRPCTSLRTLVPYPTEVPVLKTSVAALMTSTERSMSRHTVLQGPVYNEYLRRIERLHPDLFQNVELMDEWGGLCWHQSSPSERARNLSLLFRRRPPALDGDYTAVPCSTLPQPVLHASQAEGQTYFAYFLSRGDGWQRRFEAYLRLVLPFHLKLYLCSGIALEAHLQNCAVVWDEQGMPLKMWVRDWGGLRADAEVLRRQAPDLLACLSRESVTLRDAATAEKKLLACLYCNHLTELVYHTSRAFAADERRLWSLVAEVTRESLEGFESSSLARRVLQELWPVKCLLRMRLGQGEGGDLYQLRTNPISVR